MWNLESLIEGLEKDYSERVATPERTQAYALLRIALAIERVADVVTKGDEDE